MASATDSSQMKNKVRKRKLPPKDKVFAEVAEFFKFAKVEAHLPVANRLNRTKKTFNLLPRDLVNPNTAGHVVHETVSTKQLIQV